MSLNNLSVDSVLLNFMNNFHENLICLFVIICVFEKNAINLKKTKGRKKQKRYELGRDSMHQNLFEFYI